MTAPLAAEAIGSSARRRCRHLAKGVAAAGALSLAVHAAVLFVRVPSGGAPANGAPPAPVLLTRLVLAEPTAAARPETASLSAPKPAVPPPPAEPAKPETVTATPDRDATAARPPPQPRAAVPETRPAIRSPAEAPASEPVTADTSPVAAPPAPTVTYQGAMGLDPPPRPLGEIDPLVPEAAGARGGVVVLRLYINEHGTVDRAEVLRSTPPGLFDASAVEAFSNAKFSPGYLAGIAVKSQMTIEVKFRALGSGAESAIRTY